MRAVALLALLAGGASALPPRAWRPRQRQAAALRVGGDDDASQSFELEQRTDHFGGQGGGTWAQRYFVNDTFWQAGGQTGPVFLCVGGEGTCACQGGGGGTCA